MTDVFDQTMPILFDAARLGARLLPNGVHLIGNVPHVAPDAYFHVVYPPLSHSQIDSMENEIGRPLPLALRAFYRRANGMQLFAYALSIDGLRRGYSRTGDEAWQPYSIVMPNVTERPADVPEPLVFFGGYEWDGSLLGMSPDSPAVYRFAPGSAQIVNEWPDFQTMLLNEVHRLALLFDADGRKLDANAPTTPQATGRAMPPNEH